MSLSKVQCKFAHDVSKLITYIYWKQYKCTLGEAFRTKEQAKFNADHNIGILDSQHCKRLAIDLNLFSSDGEYLTRTEDYKDFGSYWKSLSPNNRWGGDFHNVNGETFSDANHFEAQE